VLFVITGCGGENSTEKSKEKKEIRVPPVEYKVGHISTDNEYVEKYIELNISVSPQTSKEKLKELLEYFDKEKYSNYDMLKIRVFDSNEYAQRTSIEQTHLLAELNITRPNHRELNIYQISPSEDKTYDVLINETVEVYLGDMSNLFDSGKQAQYLLKMMDETPNRTIYKLMWLQPQKVILTYSVKQEMLVRKHEGISEETWLGMDKERLERAGKGAGFGGPKTPGITYKITPYHGKLEDKD
jgi:hypothetical protein